MNSSKVYRFLCYTAGSGFGVGYFPFASGTAGSAATLPVAFGLAYYFGTLGLILTAVLTFLIGVLASSEILKYTKHDPSLIIIDEVVGQLITLAFAGSILYKNLNTFGVYLAAFFLFRLFDVLKPQPAKWADQKVLNAWGVMLDDVFAGIYAGLVLYAACRFLGLM